MRGTLAACAATVAAVLLVSGCSSSTSGTGSTSSSSASTTTSSAASTPSSSASETVTPAQLDAALLTPSDLGTTYGPKFATGSYQNSDHGSPCNASGPTLEATDPPTVRVGTTLVSQTLKADLTEEVLAFADAAHSAQALAFLESSVNCKSGALPLSNGSSLPVTFGSVQDVTAQLSPAAKAVAVQVSATGLKIVLASAQLGRALIVFTFVAPTSVPNSVLPNPIDVAAVAVHKVAAS